MVKTTIFPNIDELKARLTPLFDDDGLRLVLVFGSVATGTTHRKSDVDLAFLYSRPVDIVLLTNRVIRLLHLDNVDVVDLMRASPLVKLSAVKTGKPLFEKYPGMFHEFYSLAFRMYADTKKLRFAKEQSIRLFLEAKDLR